MARRRPGRRSRRAGRQRQPNEAVPPGEEPIDRIEVDSGPALEPAREATAPPPAQARPSRKVSRTAPAPSRRQRPPAEEEEAPAEAAPKPKQRRRSRPEPVEPEDAPVEEVEEAAEDESEAKSSRRSRRSTRRSKRSKRSSRKDEEDEPQQSRRRRRRLPKITLSMLKWPAIIVVAAGAVVVAASIKPYMRRKSFAALSSKEEDVRRAAALSLAAQGTGVVDNLANVLVSGNEEAREAATLALANIAFRGGDEAVVDAMRKILQGTPETELRVAVAKVLGMSARPSAAEALKPLLDDSEVAVRKAGTEELQYAKFQSAVEYHLKAMADPHHEVQTAAANSIETCVTKDAVPLLAKALKTSPKVTVQRTCAKALLELQEHVQSKDVLQAAGSEETDVRLPVMTILAAKAEKEALPVLAKAVHDKVAEIRRLSIGACALKNHVEIAGALPDILDKDNSAEVRRVAAAAIGKLKVTAGAPVLLAKLAKEHEPAQVRIACARAFGDFGPDDFEPAFRLRVIRQLIDTLRYRGVIGELAGGAASSLPKVTGVGTPLTPEQWVEWFKANRDRDKVVAEYRDQVAALKRSSSGGDKAMKEAMYKSQDLRDAIGKAKRKFKDPGELDTLYWELDKLAREWDAKTKHIKEEDLEKND